MRTDPTPELTRDKTFRAGFAELARRDLTFDAWLYHPQLASGASAAEKIALFSGTAKRVYRLG